MDKEELKTIRAEIDINQEDMATLIQCDYVGYRRYESGGRSIPSYISRNVQLIHFLHQKKMLEKFKKHILSDLTM
jgi:DNA-binding XRE family transcriptional regulator